MPFYTIDRRNGLVKSSYKQSPVITLESDAASAEAIPAAVRSAVDSMLFGNLKAFRTTRVPRGTDGVVTWLDGEQLLEGDVASIRQNFERQDDAFLFPYIYRASKKWT